MRSYLPLITIYEHARQMNSSAELYMRDELHLGHVPLSTSPSGILFSRNIHPLIPTIVPQLIKIVPSQHIVGTVKMY